MNNARMGMSIQFCATFSQGDFCDHGKNGCRFMATTELMDVFVLQKKEKTEELLHCFVFVWSRGSEVELRYHIAGNLRGRKVLRISRISARSQASGRAQLVSAYSINLQKFSPRNLHARCFAKVFSFETFPLYSMTCRKTAVNKKQIVHLNVATYGLPGSAIIGPLAYRLHFTQLLASTSLILAI